MTQYRLKPPSFEARQFKGLSTDEDWKFADWLGRKGDIRHEPYGRALWCNPGANEVVLRPGYWVVMEADGSLVVFSDAEFKAQYEPEPAGSCE